MQFKKESGMQDRCYLPFYLQCLTKINESLAPVVIKAKAPEHYMVKLQKRVPTSPNSKRSSTPTWETGSKKCKRKIQYEPPIRSKQARVGSEQGSQKVIVNPTVQEKKPETVDNSVDVIPPLEKPSDFTANYYSSLLTNLWQCRDLLNVK